MRAFQPVTQLDMLFKKEHIEFPSNKVTRRLRKFLSLCREGQPFFESHCDRVKVLLDLNSAYVFDVSGQQKALNSITLLLSRGAQRGKNPAGEHVAEGVRETGEERQE